MEHNDPTPEEVRERFLALIAAEGLPEPDDTWLEGRSVGFRWIEPRLIVYVDPDDDAIRVG